MLCIFAGYFAGSHFVVVLNINQFGAVDAVRVLVQVLSRIIATKIRKLETNLSLKVAYIIQELVQHIS